jgi:hypothetical protein
MMRAAECAAERPSDRASCGLTVLLLRQRRVSGLIIPKKGVQHDVFVDPPLSHSLAQHAFLPHPHCLEHFSRRGIADHVVRANAIQSQGIETELDHRPGGFSRIPPTPPLPSNPEPQLSLLMFEVNIAESDTADQAPVGQQPDGEVGSPAAHRFSALLADPG